MNTPRIRPENAGPKEIPLWLYRRALLALYGPINQQLLETEDTPYTLKGLESMTDSQLINEWLDQIEPYTDDEVNDAGVEL